MDFQLQNHNIFETSGLYTAVEMGRFGLTPLRSGVKYSSKMLSHPLNPMSYLYYGRSINAIYELLERMTRVYSKPEFGIKTCLIDNKQYLIKEQVVLKKTFCNLLHFKKQKFEKILPKLIIVAPMSGHYATLCRGTVEGLLPFFDVYITDWANVRDVPLAEGSFDLDDYIDYCMDIFAHLKESVHVLAVCQPAVPVSIATAIMHNEDCPYIPKSNILIGGPMDTRISPTEVNHFASRRALNWFENNLVTRVPANYPGFMRDVYPGFLQLTGFMAMNMQKHAGEHMKLFKHLVVGDGESAESHKKFYDEYLAVMDLPAEFYLQTVREVFHKHSLPNGNFDSRGRPAKLSDIRNTAILAIEGELDDITGKGQTISAIDLCSNLKDSMKKSHIQKGVGHYGLFNGSKFKRDIVPLIKDFACKFN